LTGPTPPPAQTPQELLAPARKLAALITISAALLFLRAVIPDPLVRAFGDRVSEAPAHLWGLWTTTEHLFSTGPFFRAAEVNHPQGYTSDLMDPVSLVVFAPVCLLFGGGPKAAVLAWNALHFATVLLAGLGGWRLARRLVPDPVAAVVTTAVCAASPYLMASASLGRSEYLAGAWWPLHLAFLHAHLGVDRRRSDTVGAVATLVGLAHSGWTLALWVAALEIPLALAFSRQIASRRVRLLRLLGVAVPAILLSLPFLLSVLWLDPWWLKRLQPGAMMPSVLVMPLQDLLRIFRAYPVGGGLEAAPYPGTVAPILIAVALWRRGGPAWAWTLLAGAILILALGPEVQIAGPTGWLWRGYAPVSWLQSLFPRLLAIQNWPRIAALMGAPLGVAAAWGIAATGRRRPRHHLLLAGLLAAGVVLDDATWALPRKETSFDVALPEEDRAALAGLPEGAVLELPVDNDQLPEYGVWEDFSLLWQLQHGRPTSEAPSPIRASVYHYSMLAKSIASGLEPDSQPCTSSEAARLREAGFGAVIFQKRRVPKAYVDPLERAITGVLGEAAVSNERIAGWPLPLTTGEIPEACEAPL